MEYWNDGIVVWVVEQRDMRALPAKADNGLKH
jgi:hypothetical protein